MSFHARACSVLVRGGGSANGLLPYGVTHGKQEVLAQLVLQHHGTDQAAEDQGPPTQQQTCRSAPAGIAGVLVGEEDKEALEERKRRTVQSYLEQRLGNNDPDRITLAVLLQRHGVVVRGGQAEALRLMDALTAWKANKWTAEPSS